MNFRKWEATVGLIMMSFVLVLINLIIWSFVSEPTDLSIGFTMASFFWLFTMGLAGYRVPIWTLNKDDSELQEKPK